MYPRLRNPCIICEKREGTIRCEDGMVCGECMPKAFLPDAAGISRKKIEYYWRIHRGKGLSAGIRDSKPRYSGIPCQTFAITPGCGFELIDALEDSISHADEIDMVVSFIKESGLNLMADSLRERAEEGARIRVITTTYMGSTEADAVMELAELPNTEVRMELETTADDHIHAKSFIFADKNGGGEAYVGSANISKSALTTAEEWGIRISEKDLPAVFRGLRSAYDKLWESHSLETVSKGDRARIERALSRRGMGR